MRLSPRNLAAAGLVTLLPSLAFGGGIPTSTGWLEEVVVSGKLERLGGDPSSATVGIATSEQLDLRPVLRTGELLEVVPGLVVTQHSGSGKANQYFLRGFNLDHGTDLATSVDGVPVNMPTHAHGQGYTDINFVIPELIESIEYRKGTYYADTGNFSAAGAVNLRYRSALDAPFVSVESGDDDYLRGLFAASPEIGGGSLLMALEHSTTNGPWLLEERFHKTNALLRYSHETAGGRFAVTAQGYDGEWRSTDQIPLRAVQSGALDRFGFVDPTNGGESHRYTLAADWYEQLGEGRLHANAYAIDYRLDLFSNFTYCGRHRERRPVRAVRRPPRVWRAAELDAADRADGPVARAGSRCRTATRRHRHRRPVQDGRAYAHRHDARGRSHAEQLLRRIRA